MPLKQPGQRTLLKIIVVWCSWQDLNCWQKSHPKLPSSVLAIRRIRLKQAMRQMCIDEQRPLMVEKHIKVKREVKGAKRTSWLKVWAAESEVQITSQTVPLWLNISAVYSAAAPQYHWVHITVTKSDYQVTHHIHELFSSSTTFQNLQNVFLLEQ